MRSAKMTMVIRTTVATMTQARMTLATMTLLPQHLPPLPPTPPPPPTAVTMNLPPQIVRIWDFSYHFHDSIAPWGRKKHRHRYSIAFLLYCTSVLLFMTLSSISLLSSKVFLNFLRFLQKLVSAAPAISCGRWLHKGRRVHQLQNVRARYVPVAPQVQRAATQEAHWQT